MTDKVRAATAGAVNGGAASLDFNTYYEQMEAEKSRYFAEVADQKQSQAKERAERGS